LLFSIFVNKIQRKSMAIVHKHDRREKMTLFAKWAKLWIRTPAKVAT
jgi:hypothetical protein